MKVTRAEPLHQSHFYNEHTGFLDRFLIKSVRERPGFNRRMFDQDFARIFHSSHHHRDNFFKLITNDEKLKNRLFDNVSTRYGSHSVDKTIRQMVEDIAQSLLWSGDAYYFLQDYPDKEETSIVSINAERIFTIGGNVFQFLPKRHERHFGEGDEIYGRELRLLDKKKIMRFHLPKSIRRILSAQNSILTSLDKHQHSCTDFMPRATHENPTPQYNFDLRMWSDTHDFALYRATRKTGWNGRKYDSERCSDFFNCHRLIRFRRNQVVLRDHILAQLSDELTRIGKQYKSGFKILILPTNVLPSEAELNELEARLLQEEAGFTEVVDFFFKR